MLKAAFIFLAGGAEYMLHREVVRTPSVELTVIGVGNYDDAVCVTKELVEAGCKCIELCGGFGFKGTARVVEAAEDKAVVGAVRFDCHPGLGGDSGDKLF